MWGNIKILQTNNLSVNINEPNAAEDNVQTFRLDRLRETVKDLPSEGVQPEAEY